MLSENLVELGNHIMAGAWINFGMMVLLSILGQGKELVGNPIVISFIVIPGIIMSLLLFGMLVTA